MKEYRVTCICKAAEAQPPADITHIGNATDRWVMPLATVLEHLERGTAAFYVLHEPTGQRSSVGFARETGRTPYLFSHVAGRCNAQLWELDVVAQGSPPFA